MSFTVACRGCAGPLETPFTKKRGTCNACLRGIANRYHELKPWMRTLSGARSRCRNERHKQYHRYGGRGIKCLLTAEQIEFLWVRDGASKMKRASIDRIDNNGNYEVSNCRFMEQPENSRLGGYVQLALRAKAIAAFRNGRKTNNRIPCSGCGEMFYATDSQMRRHKQRCLWCVAKYNKMVADRQRKKPTAGGEKG